VTSEILDQPRSLKITFRDDMIYDINSLKYMMKLLTHKHNFSIDSKIKPSMMTSPYAKKEKLTLLKEKYGSSEMVRSVNSSSPVLI